MAKYKTKATVKVRVPNDKNIAKISWFKQKDEELEADTLEELAELAAQISPPDDLDVEAISIEMYVHIEPQLTGRNRSTAQIHVFREF